MKAEPGVVLFLRYVTAYQLGFTTEDLDDVVVPPYAGVVRMTSASKEPKKMPRHQQPGENSDAPGERPRVPGQGSGAADQAAVDPSAADQAAVDPSAGRPRPRPDSRLQAPLRMSRRRTPPRTR